MALADTAELAVVLRLKDEMSRGLASAKRGLAGFDKATSNTQGSLNKFGANIGKIAKIGAVGFAGAMVVSVKAAGDFEAQLNTINTIARETPEGLARIGDSIRKIARDTGTPLEDLTQGYYDLLSAGIEAADATEVLTAANTLAIGGLATTAESVDLLTTAINSYGAEASDAGSIADVFAKTIERGRITAADLAGVFAQVAPLAAEMGVEIEELGAGFADLTAGGTGAAEAATQMSSALTALLKKTPALEDLEEQTGKNYAALAGSKGLNVALEEMRTDADKAGIELIELVGRKEALLYILQTTGGELAGYNENLKAMAEAEGTAADQMSERQKGLNFQLARLKALATDAGITIGSALLPKLTPLVDKLNTFINEHQDDIAKFGTDLADAFEKVADAVGKTDWTPFIDGLKLSADLAKGAFDAFRSLPADFQKLILVGAGVNKITGGLLTSLSKDAIKIVFDQFAARGASPANPVWVASVGGGLGGPGGAAGAAGAGGKLGSLIKGLGTAAVITAPLVVAAELQPEVTKAIAGDNVLTNPQKWLPPEPEGGAKPFWELIANAITGSGGNVARVPENPRIIEKLQQHSVQQTITNERLEAIKGYTSAQSQAQSSLLRSSERNESAIRDSKIAGQAAAFAVRDKVGTSGSLIQGAINATKAVTSSGLAGVRTAAQQTAFAVRDKDFSVSVTVPVSIRNFVEKSNTIKTVYRTQS